MIESEKKEFKEMFDALLNLPLLKAPSGKELPKDMLRMYWDALQHRGLQEIRYALNRHIQDSERGRFFPLPADISAQLPAERNPWLDANEAWAMCPKDEESSAAVCEEMSQALGVAWPLIEEGDMVAARMAFKSAYDRLVSDAKAAGRKPKWFASLGFDKHGRHEAQVRAVEMTNLCLPDSERLALPAPESDQTISLEELSEKAASRPGVTQAGRDAIKNLKKELGLE